MAGDDDKDGENPLTFTELYKKLNRKDCDSIDRLSTQVCINVCQNRSDDKFYWACVQDFCCK